MPNISKSYRYFNEALEPNGYVYVADIVKVSGISSVIFSDWKRMKSFPGEEKLRALCRLLNLDADKMLGLVEEDRETRNKMREEKLNSLLSSKDNEQHGNEGERKEKPEHLCRLPIIKEVSRKLSEGDIPFMAHDSDSDVVSSVCRLNGLVGIKVHDDSMSNLRICSGDVAVIDPKADLADGEIGLFIVQEQPLIRTFYQDESTTMLLPANPQYKPITLTDQDFKIVGKVVAVTIELE